MFEPTLTTPLPPYSVATKSFTELMHEITSDSIDPICLEVIAPLPTYPNVTTPLPTQPKIMLDINCPSNPHQTFNIFYYMSNMTKNKKDIFTCNSLKVPLFFEI